MSVFKLLQTIKILDFGKLANSSITTERLRIVATFQQQEKVTAAKNCGELSKDSPVTLNPKSHPKDPNAVEVFSKSGYWIGYIPQERSKEFRNYCLEGKITSTKILSAKKVANRRWYEIYISVQYLDTKIYPRKNFLIPEKLGIYQISLGLNKTYIGSSGNLRQRCYKHLTNLLNDAHTNNSLQADFNQVGQDSFDFSILSFTSNREQALREEHREILKRRAAGEALYNKTIDGQGWAGESEGSLNTVSDFNFSPSELEKLHEDLLAEKGETEASLTEALEDDIFLDVLERYVKNDEALTLNLEKKESVNTFSPNAYGQSNRVTQNPTDLSETNKRRDQRTSQKNASRTLSKEKPKPTPTGRYEGEISRNLANGAGVLEYPNGDVYKGQFKNGLPHGQGKLYISDMCRDWEGSFEKGIPSLGGRIIFDDGVYDKYQGECFKYFMHGNGKLYYSSGRVFEGIFHKDFTVSGILKLPNGDEYEGEIREGVMHGQGVLRLADGTIQRGNFFNDLLQGEGAIEYSDGGVYEGAFDKGVAHGRGLYTAADGSKDKRKYDQGYLT